MSLDVKITFDTRAVAAKIEGAAQKATAILAGQALSDCNEFCPEDQGVLINSSSIHSDLKKGLLVWSTPYARYLYYGLLMVDSKTGSAWAREGDRKVLTDIPLNYSKSGACKLWCEKARETYGDEWRSIYENALRKELK